jgi:hypothetical protein
LKVAYPAVFSQTPGKIADNTKDRHPRRQLTIKHMIGETRRDGLLRNCDCRDPKGGQASSYRLRRSYPLYPWGYGSAQKPLKTLG